MIDRIAKLEEELAGLTPVAGTNHIGVSLKLQVEGQGEILLECTAPEPLTFVACNRLVETMKTKIREARQAAERAPYEEVPTDA